MIGRFVMAAYFQLDEEIREARMGQIQPSSAVGFSNE